MLHVLRLTTLLSAVWWVAAAPPLVPGKAFDRLITIWLENQDFDNVTVDANIEDLMRQGLLLTRFFALTHPSQPNYLAAVGGDYFGLNHDGPVRVPENVSTVVDLLDDARISWAGYFEDLPGPGYMAQGSDGHTGNGGWDYVRKHNPFVSYDSVCTNGSRLLNLLSLDSFTRALDADELPQFVFITPNMMNDGHNTTLQYATDWSHSFLQPLLSSPSLAASRTLIMLTYDESETYTKPNHIVTLLLGSAVPAALKGTHDDTFYTHYSLLATMELNWQLAHLGRYDVGANVFAFVADQAAANNNRDPANAPSVDNSVAYPGPLHGDPAQQRAWPPPNLHLIGPGGKPVLQSIRDTWEGDALADTPYDGSGNVVDGAKNSPVYKKPAANVA